MTTTTTKPSRLSVSPRCPGCGRGMRLRWRIRDPHSDEHDLRQFTCGCGVQYGDRVARDPGEAAVA